MKIETMEWWANWRAQVLCGAFALVMALAGGLLLDLAIRAASAPGVAMLWPWYSTALVVVTAVLWTLSFVAAIVAAGERLTRPLNVTEGWNRCPTCKGHVETDSEVFDGDTFMCRACNKPLAAAISADGTTWLYDPSDAPDDEEPGGVST